MVIIVIIIIIIVLRSFGMNTGTGTIAAKENPGTILHESSKNFRNKKSLIIGTLNFINGNANRLDLACSTLNNIGIDIGLLTE